MDLSVTVNKPPQPQPIIAPCSCKNKKCPPKFSSGCGDCCGVTTYTNIDMCTRPGISGYMIDNQQLVFANRGPESMNIGCMNEDPNSNGVCPIIF